MPGDRDRRIVVDRDSESRPARRQSAMSGTSGSRPTQRPKPTGEGAWSPWPAIALAILVGAIARAAPVLAAGFPDQRRRDVCVPGGLRRQPWSAPARPGHVQQPERTVRLPAARVPPDSRARAADPDRDGRVAALDPTRGFGGHDPRVRAVGARDHPLTGPRRGCDVRVCADAQQLRLAGDGRWPGTSPGDAVRDPRRLPPGAVPPSTRPELDRGGRRAGPCGRRPIPRRGCSRPSA